MGGQGKVVGGTEARQVRHQHPVVAGKALDVADPVHPGPMAAMQQHQGLALAPFAPMQRDAAGLHPVVAGTGFQCRQPLRCAVLVVHAAPALSGLEHQRIHRQHPLPFGHHHQRVHFRLQHPMLGLQRQLRQVGNGLGQRFQIAPGLAAQT